MTHTRLHSVYAFAVREGDFRLAELVSRRLDLVPASVVERVLAGLCRHFTAHGVCP